MKTEKERMVDFLIGLAKLTRETGIVVSGCGCCGSPSIDAIEPAAVEDARAGYGCGWQGQLAWISPSDKYDWEKYRASIPGSTP